MAKARPPIPCLIHIPCLYPDGTEIEAEKTNKFLEVFDRQFGGATVLGRVDGLWQGISEPMLRVEVSVKKSDIPKFERIAKQIGRDTKQQVMYVVINFQASTQLLLIDDSSDDQQLLDQAGGN